MSTTPPTEHDVEQRLKARVALGSAEDGLALLEEFEQYDRERGLDDEDSY